MGHTIRGLSKPTVIKLAWREMRATEDVHHRLGPVRRACADAWGSFIGEELGFGLLQGPTIIATMQDLENINRAHREPMRPPMRGPRSRKATRVTGKRARRAVHERIRLRRSS